MAIKLFNRTCGVRTREPQRSAPGGGYWFPFGSTTAGKAVSERTAMTTTAVYACIRVLSEAIAGLPLHVYQYRADGGKERCPAHPLYRLLHDAPNDEMTSFLFRETLMAHLLLWGNAYAQIIRDGRGQVLALLPLLPNRMTVSRTGSGELIYTYSPTPTSLRTCRGPRGENGSDIALTRDSILHIAGLGFDTHPTKAAAFAGTPVWLATRRSPWPAMPWGSRWQRKSLAAHFSPRGPRKFRRIFGVGVAQTPAASSSTPAW